MGAHDEVCNLYSGAPMRAGCGWQWVNKIYRTCAEWDHSHPRYSTCVRYNEETKCLRYNYHPIYGDRLGCAEYERERQCRCNSSKSKQYQVNTHNRGYPWTFWIWLTTGTVHSYLIRIYGSSGY